MQFLVPYHIFIMDDASNYGFKMKGQDRTRPIYGNKDHDNHTYKSHF